MEYEYVIRITYGTGVGCYLQDYIGNGTYYVQGNRYVVLTNIENARRYSSEKRAIRTKIKVCGKCGVAPVLEKWWSGGFGDFDGFKCAVRCNNPDRGDECDWKFYHSMSNNREDAVRKWNEVN